MLDRLLLFGATGDLAGRYLLPALAELDAAGSLPEGFQVVGAARQPLDDEAFRRRAAERLAEFARDVPGEARERLLARLRYCRVELGAHDVAAAMRMLLGNSGDETEERRPIAAYLALPPRMFTAAVKALDEAGLPAGSRIVVEKPFGEDLEGARSLNRLLADATARSRGSSVFRVDHVLGMATVHNLVGLRLANRVLEPLWNGVHIARIEILWEETLALEGRAGYFDRTGALKDVMQNHMLQVLSLVAMEPPLSLGERDLRDRKVDALRSVATLSPEAVVHRTRRARYTAGRIPASPEAPEREVPDYAREDGVDPARETETFAEVVLALDSWRWAGTEFVLRAGKALGRRRKGVVVHFRPVPHLPFGGDVPDPAPNVLELGLDGPESLVLHLTGSAPGTPPELTSLALEAPLPAAELRAYSQVLLDALGGDCTLAIRGDEAEESWRIVTPVLEGWRAGRVPLEEYRAGSAGPG